MDKVLELQECFPHLPSKGAALQKNSPTGLLKENTLRPSSTDTAGLTSSNVDTRSMNAIISETGTLSSQTLSSYVAEAASSTTFSTSNRAQEVSNSKAGSFRTFGGSEKGVVDATTPAQSREHAQSHEIILGRIHFAAVCFSLFLSGWNDGSVGPLIPRIQDVYQINFTVVSLIFVFVCVGSLIGSLSTIYITEKFGFGKIIVFGAAIQTAGYAIQIAAPPFPAFLLSFVFTGWGLQLQEAQANSYVTALRSSQTKLGMLHASYGLGAFSSPLVSTQFMKIPRWSLFFYSDDKMKAGESVGEGSRTPENGSAFRAVMRDRASQALAFFALMYVGVEVTIGGWIVTYIINVRGGGTTSGYVSSGFWGGITIGRIALLWVNKKIGAKPVLFLYAVLAIALELVVWFVPSLVGDAIAVSVIGILFGPMYPLIMEQASRTIPRSILTGGIGWISGIGQIGSALIPFIAGAVSQKHGIKSLQPMLIGMMVFMTCVWAAVPASGAAP
ncbi:MFS general substrate transporter [Agrocybe pediades]|nr:MFS general substrate transporter [Agrocybe pediades]